MTYDFSGLNFDFPSQANSQASAFTPSTTLNRESPALPVIRSSSHVPHRHAMFNQWTNQPIPNDRQPINAVDATASINPGANVTFETTTYLIPRFGIGLQTFGGVGPSAIVFVDLNASADFTIATPTVNDARACANASTTLDFGVGAQVSPSFFNLFDASTSESLFNKDFPLVQVRITNPCSPFALK